MSEKHLFLTDYAGDPNIGMHGVLTDSYAVLAPDFKLQKELAAETVVETPLANTFLVGLFAAGNVVAPLKPGAFERDQLDTLEEDLDRIREESGHDVTPELTMVVPTMVRPNTKPSTQRGSC